MKLLKILPAALMLSLSLNAFAQDDDELLDATGDGEEATEEVVVPTGPTDKKFFQRVQLGYTGTFSKYTNHGYSPDYNNYFLHGIGLGWIGDLRIAKKIDMFLELGASLSFHAGTSRGDTIVTYHPSYSTDGDEHVFHYKVRTLALTIPVNITRLFRGAFGVKDLAIAPYIGVYARFNLMAKRKATDTFTEYTYNADGSRVAVPGTSKETSYSASLMSQDEGPNQNTYPEIDPKSKTCMSAITDKLHTGRLLQVGAQAGVNAYYKRYMFGLAYMSDITPFARHYSPQEQSTKTTAQGGRLPQGVTDCDMKVSTKHNFSITFGYVF